MVEEGSPNTLLHQSLKVFILKRSIKGDFMDVDSILNHLCKADEEFTRLYRSAQGDKSLVENNFEYKLAIAKAYESAKHLGEFIGKKKLIAP